MKSNNIYKHVQGYETKHVDCCSLASGCVTRRAPLARVVAFPCQHIEPSAFRVAGKDASAQHDKHIDILTFQPADFLNASLAFSASC